MAPSDPRLGRSLLADADAKPGLVPPLARLLSLTGGCVLLLLGLGLLSLPALLTLADCPSPHLPTFARGLLYGFNPSLSPTSTADSIPLASGQETQGGALSLGSAALPDSDPQGPPLSEALKDGFFLEPLHNFADGRQAREWLASHAPYVLPPERRAGCTHTCCVSVTNYPRYHSGTPSDPYAPHDFMATITAKYFAELHLGTLPQPQGTSLNHLSANVLPCLQNGTIIFIDSENIEDFATNYFPLIKSSFILLTGDSDRFVPGTSPGNPHRPIARESVDALLRSPLVIHWYAMNCDELLDPARFSCFLNGANQWDDHSKSVVRVYESYSKGVVNTPKRKDHPVLVSFGTASNPPIREHVWTRFCDANRGVKELVEISKCYYDQHISADQYFADMAASKFVLSPPGAGLDCYRHAEAIYFGAIPVVQSGALDSLFKDLPALIVKSWDDITPELLLKTWEEHEKAPKSREKAHFLFWQKLFYQFRRHPHRYEYYVSTRA